MALIDNTAIMQIAIIVKDIEKTAENYAKVFGMPVPEIQDVPPVSEVPIFYRGERTDSRAKICCFQMGEYHSGTDGAGRYAKQLEGIL